MFPQFMNEEIKMAELLCKKEVFALVGAGMEVYNVLGPGFLEPVYQEAYETELAARKIPFSPRKELRIWYRRDTWRRSTSLTWWHTKR